METKMSGEQKAQLKMAYLICSSVLGFIALVGIFWGKEGMINLGIGLFITIIAIMFIAISSWGT